MGRVRSKTVKKASKVIIDKHNTKLTQDFHTNKRICEEIAFIASKKLKNRIAGFIAHLMKRIERGAVRGISIKLREEERERRFLLSGNLDPRALQMIKICTETRKMIKNMGLNIPNAVVIQDDAAKPRKNGKTRHTAASRLHPFLFRRTAAQAIVKKYATMEVKPRIPLFCCSRCGMVTRRANNIRGHDCTLRKGLTFWRGTGAGASAQLNSVGDNEIDDELLALASRNKIRDGLAIMERTGWPQNIAVDEIEQETITEECLERPGPSRILTLRAMSSVVLASPSSSSSDSASSASSSGSSSSRSSISVDEAFEQRRARIVSKRAIGRARLLSGRACGSCGDLFASFADYDAHLGDDVANPDPVCGRLPPCPVPIAINDCSTIPVEYDFVRRRAREHSPRRMKIGACTSCGEREFETMPELHDHIVSCARKSLQARMAAATKGGGRK